LSDEMRKTVERRCVPVHKIRVINNFASDSRNTLSHVKWQFHPSEAREFRLLFAGNMGTFQALDVLIDAAHLLRATTEIQFHFLGAGESMARLQQRGAALLGQTVHFSGRQRQEVAMACMSQSDLGIISLSQGMHRVSFPSKLMTYLATGLPVLAIVEPTCELAHLIRDQGIGYVPRSATPQCVAETIWEAYCQCRAGQGPSRAHVRRISDRLFDRTRTLDQWTKLVQTFEAFEAKPITAQLSPATPFAN
jgi:glycosyltransferase involved in cell wall biosynthesis